MITSDADPASVGKWAPAEVGEIDLYQKREKIYTRKIEGFFQRIRVFTGWPLLCGYFLLPWVQWDGRPAVLFDLPARKFYIFWFTFWPQDFSMLAWLLAIAAFSLFLFTALFGRVWCGYTCPQTVWTSMFMWVEQWTEGSRNQRIKLDAEPWSSKKLFKKLAKHSMWFGVAFLTGFTFIAYFTPADELAYQFFSAHVGLTEFSWVMFFTLATYINAGWMREQVCLYMCPYARFQSVMFDKNTLIVSYDTKRGEPRGSRKQGVDHKNAGLGDCIDCQLCVQVCPTGIDIRKGLQYECIGCALCVDACDSVMAKMHYPTGLIRYTTENKLKGLDSKLLRPRVVGYSLVILAMCSLLAYRLGTRTLLQLDVIRDRGQLYVLNDNGGIENSYTLNVINMDDQDHLYRLSVHAEEDELEHLVIVGEAEFFLHAGEVKKVPVRLLLPADENTGYEGDNDHERDHHDEAHPDSEDIIFSAQALDNDKLRAQHKSRFIVPVNP